MRGRVNGQGAINDDAFFDDHPETSARDLIICLTTVLMPLAGFGAEDALAHPRIFSSDVEIELV